MEDKAIQWLENNMNTNDLFYFKQNKDIKSIIDCYFKIDDRKFCVFYREIIEQIIYQEEIEVI